MQGDLLERKPKLCLPCPCPNTGTLLGKVEIMPVKPRHISISGELKVLTTFNASKKYRLQQIKVTCQSKLADKTSEQLCSSFFFELYKGGRSNDKADVISSGACYDSQLCFLGAVSPIVTGSELVC